MGTSGDGKCARYSSQVMTQKKSALYVEESDEEETEGDTNPERHPNRLRWRWSGLLNEALDAATKRERATSAGTDGDQAAGGERVARRPRRTTAAGDERAARRSRRATTVKPLRQPAPRRPSGAALASRDTAERTRASPGRHAPPAPVPPPGSHPAPLPPLSLRQFSTLRPSPYLSRRLILEQRSQMTRAGLHVISRHQR